MSQAAVVVLWLGTTSSHLHLQADLQSWATSRNVRLTAPAPPHTTALVYDTTLPDRIERLIERARIEAGSHDERSALIHVREARTELERHPELPQAAWLMAEALLLEATVHATYPERERITRRLRSEAALLEGQRAQVHGTAPALRATSAEQLRVTIGGTHAGDVIYVNGVRAPSELVTNRGTHHIRVTRGARAIWSGWVEVGGKARLELPVPEPAACSRDDLRVAHITASGVAIAGPVRCARWAVARPAKGGGIEIAECRHARCSAFTEWRASMGRFYEGPPQEPRPADAPPVLPWVIASVGAAALTGLVLWQAGVFDGPGEPRTVWRFEGP
jgi:hypothetical protein